MSVAIAAEYAGAFFVTPFDGALSREAVELRQKFDQALTTEGSVAGSRREEIGTRLITAFQDAIRDGVDISPESFCRALAVIQALPNRFPLPDVVVEGDGEIGLDWDFGRAHVLSISVGDGPMLRYAALISSEPVHGRVPFAGVFPRTLSFFLSRLI
jgi:hypothetical protein